MKNKKIYVLVACLAVVLTGCGLNLEKKAVAPEAVKEAAVVNEVATSTEEVASTTENQNSSAVGDVNLDPSTWKVYSDSKHGFELKIPQKGVVVGVLTFAEAKAIDEKQEKDYLVEGGMAYAPVFSWMHDGSAGKDFEKWTLGDKKYDYYKKDVFYARCKKDANSTYSCFFLSQEGMATFYETIIYHNGARIAISIDFPNDRFISVLDEYQSNEDVKKRVKGMSDLLNLYINNDFNENEKEYIDAMDKIIASLKFAK
jgi:hypothetical protein